MLITTIEPRKHSLSALFLDGEFAMNLDTETLLKEGWKLGLEIDDEQLYELKCKSENRQAKEKALSLLEYRNHSKKELADKIKKVAGADAAQAAAEQMEKLGLIDDERFARNLTTELFKRKGFSASRVRCELEQKGIDRELAQQMIEELAPSPVEKVKEILERKYSRLPDDEKNKKRTVNAFLRLGYRYEEIKTAFNEMGRFQNRDEDE